MLREPGQVWEGEGAFPSCDLSTDLIKHLFQPQFIVCKVSSRRPFDVPCLSMNGEAAAGVCLSEHLLPPREHFLQTQPLQLPLVTGETGVSIARRSPSEAFSLDSCREEEMTSEIFFQITISFLG